MSEAKLVERIESSVNKKHALLSWVALKLEEVNAEEALKDDDSRCEEFLGVCAEIDAFIRYNAGLPEDEQLDSYYVFQALSHLYGLYLTRLEKVRPGRIYDSAELLATVLAEDDVTIEVTEKKKKKSSKKRSYIRSAAKEMACIALIQFYETFNQQLSSLAPLLFGIIFKNLKKIMEKSKYAHATFATSLMQLLKAILKNVGGSSFYHEYFPKFSKLSKKVFEAICSDRQEFSTDMVSAIMEIWSYHFRRESFVKDNKHNLENAILANYSEGELGPLGFVNDFSRHVVARTLAEVMFDYFKISEVLGIEQILQFYATLFERSVTRDAQAGTFESIVHFLGLCLSADISFFEGSQYLEIVRTLASSIFSPSCTSNHRVDSMSRSLRYFVYMHTLLLPKIEESSKNLIVLQLLSPSQSAADTTSDYTINSDPENLWLNLALLDLAQLLLSELSSCFGNEKHLVDEVKKTLIRLSICDNFTLRIHASAVLKLFLSNFPQYLSGTIEGSLNALSKNFKQDDNFLYTANHGHALVIANLIACADKDYVSFELIMRITVFATSFIKNHTTTTTTPLYSKNLLCWILLIGCMNYKDDRYLQMQSSQLFLFWKVLLTHNYSSRHEDDLYRNLEIRNHALTCLLAFLGNDSIGNKAVAKQVSYLLTKCSSFNHAIIEKSDKIDKALLTNELRLLQIHLRLHKYIKDDFNSSLLILIMKNFSDPNLYSEGTHSLIESLTSVADGKKSSSEQTPNFGEPSVVTLLRQDDGFAYGLSSRLSGANVSELYVKDHGELRQHLSFESKQWSWNFEFENEITKPISCALSQDYLLTLYCAGGYSSSDKCSPKITTALIDASMEVFSLKFPFLNDKIKYSIIETLNSSMFCRTTSTLRNVAIAANTLVSINKALEVMHEEGITLEHSVGELLLKSVDKIKFDNDHLLTEMKAKCIGLVCGIINRNSDEDRAGKDMVTERVDILIDGLIKVDEPFTRVLRALSLVNIYRYRPADAPFCRIFDVILSLISDPHPVVHCWSLKAMHLLIDKHAAIDHTTASTLLGCLEDISTNPSYGMYGSSVLRYNYCLETDSHLTVGLILQSLSEAIGAYISELPANVCERFKYLIYGLAISNSTAHQLLALEIYANLAIFKNQNSLDDRIFIKLAESIVNGAILVGFSSACCNCHFMVKNGNIPNSFSSLSVMKCFDLFCLLTKLQKGHLFAQDLENSSWRWLFLSPSSKELQNYLFTWMGQSPEDEIKWFDKLYVIFHISKWRLFFSYYRTLNGLLKKIRFKKEGDEEIPSEEEKSIAQAELADFDGSQNSDLLPWRARLLILKMVKHLCLASARREGKSVLLSRKIPELIKLAFQASTSSVASVKSLGLDILRLVLKANSSLRSSESGPSELQQQEAQIVSAMMPAFNSGTPPDIVVSAIDLSAEILTSGISTVQEMHRVSQLLIDCLGIFNENKSSVRLGDVLIETQKSKKKIELSVLSAWAELTEKSVNTDELNLREFTENYWDILVPLWIISLREYAMVKYEGKQTDELTGGHIKESFFEKSKLELFEGAWLNMVVALSCVLEANPDVVLQRLSKTETESFMLILFIQCMEIVVKSLDDHEVLMKILPALHSLLMCCVPLDLLFEDGTNEEIVGVLDRIMTMGNNQEKLMLVRIINDLIMRYVKKNDTHDTFLQGIDKLYELLRLLIKPIAQLLPFIKYSSLENEVSRTAGLAEDEVRLLRASFSALESNVGKFDDLFKVDLYSCLLFMIGEIFESDAREEVIPIVLPLLKSVSRNLLSGSLNSCLMQTFFESIKKALFDQVQLTNQLAICFILLANNYPYFTESDLNRFISLILSGLRSSDTQAITMHGLRSLVNKGMSQHACRYIIRNLILEIFKSIGREDTQTVDLMFEFVQHFVKRVLDTEPKSAPTAMAVILSLELLYCGKDGVPDERVGGRMMTLIAMDKESFKIASSSLLDEKQRARIEHIIEKSPEFGSSGPSGRKADLLLKNFV
ncbi:hypothetical protein HG536_0B01430 [Torulaspora globosa]|uniref:LAA1-like C-terminal TPR repeats domain-containing protein n=1 Tax=Torulaspora globosa TaxID=48254 RepID=A0A7G3ZCP5_9SACH|nr:uncharacterized protein HG536_0B01430 [Torulaspora globosa]QLL31281.1 hypothetical protein HG536_0B01430 [Torulaspora globosa]